MGHLKDILNQPKQQTFPTSTFEIAGEVPAAQCSEAKIEDDHGVTTAANPILLDIGKFIGWNLAGKVLTVTSPAPNARNYGIIANTDNFLTTDDNFTVTSDANKYYVHNGPELILTRNVQSFAQFIHAAGYAYTIKGAKLFTNMPSLQLKNACTILFDPLT